MLLHRCSIRTITCELFDSPCRIGVKGDRIMRAHESNVDGMVPVELAKPLQILHSLLAIELENVFINS